MPPPLSQLGDQLATLQQQLQERDARIQELESGAHGTTESVVLFDSEEATPRDNAPEIVIATRSIPYPTPPQQHERAVWRNRHFCEYLESLGLLGRPVKTWFVTNWFKREWFGDERLGNKRLADAGFSRRDMLYLTIHHIVPKDVGGAHSIYNYHLVLKSVNSHFGELFTRESIAWVGADHAYVAKAFCRYARDLSDFDASKFDPFASSCPNTAVKKRRVVVRDDPPPTQVQRTGARTLEVRVASSVNPEAGASSDAAASETQANQLDIIDWEQGVHDISYMTGGKLNLSWKYATFREDGPFMKQVAGRSGMKRSYVEITCPTCSVMFLDLPVEQLSTLKWSKCKQHLDGGCTWTSLRGPRLDPTGGENN
jgi:hypothetical protein